MSRITQEHMQSQVDIVNRMLGFDPDRDRYNTPGAVQLSGAYGGWTVHQVTSEGGGVRDLIGGHGPAREASRFLSGMIAALRIREALDDV